LIRPQRASFCHEIRGAKKLVRAHFCLGANHYNFSVTDPPFEQRVKSLPAAEYSLPDLGIVREDRMLFCVSFGEPSAMEMATNWCRCADAAGELANDWPFAQHLT